MVNETEHFNDRLNRIQRGRRQRRGGMGFVVHADGVVTAIGQPSSRLRFGFPLKGLLLGLVAAVAVKSYLMWFLGTDIYTLEVQTLLAGSSFERLAAMVLMPDAVTLSGVERFEDINVFIQAGMAAGEPV